MKRNFKFVVSMMLVLCMIATVMLGSATEAQAATKYAKSISKTVELTEETWGYPTVLTFNMKQAATVTITVSCALGKEGGLNSQANISTSGKTIECSSGTNAVVLNEKGYNKLTMKVKFKKGKQTISISNGPDTYKLKVTAKKSILKYKSLKAVITEDVG